MKLEQLVEQRTRTRDRAAEAFSFRVVETARIFLHDFDQGRNSSTRNTIGIYRTQYNIQDADFVSIRDEEYFVMKINVHGWLYEIPRMSISSLYDGDEDMKKLLRKKEMIDDPYELKQYKSLVFAMSGLIDHLKATCNLRYIQIDGKLVDLKTSKVDWEPILHDMVVEVPNGYQIQHKDFPIYVKVPRKSK